MIDLHCHIIPCIDDGPKSYEESLSMLEIALKDGINKIVATPHTLNGVYLNSYDSIAEHLSQFKNTILKNQIKIKLYIGADIHLTKNLFEKIKKKEIPTINNNMRYMLLELPNNDIPSIIKNEIFSLKLNGITPIITHPERHFMIQKKTDILREFINMGALSQITAMSITGEFGDEVQKTAINMLKRRMVHIIATDAHSSTYRQPILSRSIEKAAKILKNIKEAEQMVTLTPAKVIAGEPIEIDDPM